MNKKEIKAAVSIEFGLSMEMSGRVVDNIFENIMEYFSKDKIVELQKFGKFKLVSGKDNEINKIIKFSPSKKLTFRVNSNFENLKKVKIKTSKDNKLHIKKIVTEVKKEDLPENEVGVDKAPEIVFSNEKSAEKITNPDQRKLISDDLLNLHKEITREEKEADKNNLWG